MDRERFLEELVQRALQPIDYEKLAAEQAARTDPWRWYCRICGARGAVNDGLGAREYRDKAAEEHLRDTSCGRGAIPGRAEQGRMLHVWTYGQAAVAPWN